VEQVVTGADRNGDAPDHDPEPPMGEWSSWRPVDLSREPEGPEASPEIGGVLYRGHRHLVSGEPEALKGWLCQALAVDELCAGSTVVWVDFEQGRAMTLSRFRALGATDDELGRCHYIAPREPLDSDSRARIGYLVATERPTLVVFDAYAGLLGIHDHDPNSERDIERVNRQVVDLFRPYGAAIVIVDHPVKAQAERGRYSSGSGRKLAEVDVHLRLDRTKTFGRGQHGIARIAVAKDRPGGLPHPRAGELHLHSDSPTGHVTWEILPPADAGEEPGTFRPTELMERVSRYLEAQTEPVSRTHVEENVKGKGEYVRAAIDRLLAEDHATEHPGERRARLIATSTPYRQDTDPALRPPRPDSVPTPSRDGVEHSVPRPLSLDRDGDGLDQAEIDRLATLLGDPE
jgi:hypothetical protein